MQTAFLGDVVLTTPLLRELRRARPHDRLTVLTTEGGRQALAGVPYVDELLAYDKRWTLRGLASSKRLIRQLQDSRFDVAIAAQRSWRTGWLLRLSRAPLCIGFARAPGAWAYQRQIPWEPQQHAVRRYLALAAPLGGEPERADPQPELIVDRAARERVRALLRDMNVDPRAALLCIAPGSVRAGKRWLPERFAEVAAGCAARGLAPLLIGAPGERELCEQIAVRSRARTPVLAGRTSVRELVALLASAHGVLANDSGAAHVAAAVGTPVVSIFGPTAPALGYSAFGLNTRIVERHGLGCRPCHRRGPSHCPLGHFRCMGEIAAQDVLASLDELLQSSAVQRAWTASRPG